MGFSSATARHVTASPPAILSPGIFPVDHGCKRGERDAYTPRVYQMLNAEQIRDHVRNRDGLTVTIDQRVNGVLGHRRMVCRCEPRRSPTSPGHHIRFRRGAHLPAANTPVLLPFPRSRAPVGSPPTTITKPPQVPKLCPRRYPT